MDPTSQQTPSFEMPPVAGKGETPSAMPERAPAMEGSPVPAVPAGPTTPAQPVDPSAFAQPANGPAPAAGAHPAAPAVADDLDLIEKEWVEKAKAIVAETRNDPHRQNDQMNRFKADYMKKRYNKDIKLPEGA